MSDEQNQDQDDQPEAGPSNSQLKNPRQGSGLGSVDYSNLDSDSTNAYIRHFQAHIAAFRAHLSGEDASEPLEGSFVPSQAPSRAPAANSASRSHSSLGKQRAAGSHITDDLSSPGTTLSRTYWSPQEKHLFFHGLSRFSRLRLDLIASHIGTDKSVADVYAYLELLESEAILAMEDGRIRAPVRSRDARMAGNLGKVKAATKPIVVTGNSTGTETGTAEAVLGTSTTVSARGKANKAEGAREVSEAWIQFEEHQATHLASNEPLYESVHIAEGRKRFLNDLRINLKLQHTSSTAPPVDDDSSSGPKRKRARIQPRDDTFEDKFTNLKSAHERQCAQEDFLRDLTLPKLRAIDGMFREEEEDEQFPNEMPEVAMSQSFPSGVQAGPGEDMQTENAKDVIDPALLATPTRSIERQVVDSAQPNASARATSQANVTDSDHLPDLSTLSPLSRRRLTKRLYMRRKRAQLNGTQASAKLARLKPGRKASLSGVKAPNRRSKKKNKGKEPDTNDDQDMQLIDPELLREEPRALAGFCEDGLAEAWHPEGGPMDVELELRNMKYTLPVETDAPLRDDIEITGKGDEDEPENAPSTFQPLSEPPDPQVQPLYLDSSFSVTQAHRYESPSQHLPQRGSRSQSQRFTSQFLALGLDTAKLTSLGFGLFQLTALGRLAGPSMLSADLVKLLHAHVVYFLTILMNKTTTLKEQELKLKKRSKVWKSEAKVYSSSVYCALDLMGFPELLAIPHLEDEEEEEEEDTTSVLDSDPVPSSRGNTLVPADVPSAGNSQGSEAQVSDELEEEEEEEEDEEEDELEEDEDIPFPPLSTYRQLNAPFLWHPSVSDSDTSSFIYPPNSTPLHFTPSQLLSQPSSSFNQQDSSPSQSPVLSATSLDTPNDIDVLDLLSDDELDQLDQRLDEQAERELWAKFRRDETGQFSDGSHDDDEFIFERGELDPLDSAVKSQYYILDSD